MEDAPYTLSITEEQQQRREMLTLPHMKPLTDYLASLRDALGDQYHIPNFDPCDGGIHARALFLLEAPGPKAKASGFVSSNNPDPTAKILWNLIHNAGIARADTLIWNIVPWYVGTCQHILPVNSADIRQALPYLRELLALLPHLEMIVLVGKRAQSAEPQIRLLTSLSISKVFIKHTYHMSALVFNRWPKKKKQTEEAFHAIAEFLHGNKILDGKGLDSYTAQIVQNSKWLTELENINKVHSMYNADRWRDAKHFVFWFHDSTFECVADSYKVEVLQKPLIEILALAYERMI